MPSERRPIRYAVVGLGHIAQAAVLPAFAHARGNSRVTALVSDHPRKARQVARKHRIEATYSYDEYDTCLQEIDAVYIALPNSLHAEYTIRAAQSGVHVLCEKPMAVTVDECQRMIDACRKARAAALRGGARCGLRHQLQRRRRLLVPHRGHEGSADARSSV